VSIRETGETGAYPDLEIGHRETWAVGIPAILKSMGPALKDMGPLRTAQYELCVARS
jgi:hypothetical protein